MMSGQKLDQGDGWISPADGEREREAAEDERNKYGHTNIYGMKYVGEVSWRQYWLFHFSCEEKPRM